MFSPNAPISSTNITDRHNITEILLKVTLNTINKQNYTSMYEMYSSLFYFRDIITLECGWNLYDVFVNYYKILLANTWVCFILQMQKFCIDKNCGAIIYLNSELFMNETFEWMLWRNSQCSTICDIKNYFECQKFWLGILFVKKIFQNYPLLPYENVFVSCVHHITTQHYVSHSSLVYLLSMIQTVLRTQYAYTCNVYLFCIYHIDMVG